MIMFVSCKMASSWLIRSLSFSSKSLNHLGKRHELLMVTYVSTRLESSQERKNVVVASSSNKQLSEHVKVTERIKQTTKDVTHISVILAGVGITCVVLYAVFQEFFSSKSPSSVFASALKKCKEDPRVVEALGEPIKGHGEMTSRRRARHVSFIEYDNNGKTYLRVKFYLKGSKATGTVQCETRKDSPRSQFRYLFVEIDSYPTKTIIIEDNRLFEQDQLGL